MNSLPLKFPVTITSADGKPVTVSTLAFRKPRALDLARIEKAGQSGMFVEVQMQIIASLCDQPIEVVHGLDLDDYTAATEIASSFFPSKPTTGEAE